MSAIPADLELTFASGSETFLPLGGGAEERPNAGEVIYKTGDIVVCRNFNYRESEITKLKPDTSRAVIVFEDALGNENNLRAAAEWIGNAAQTLMGAQVSHSEILKL